MHVTWAGRVVAPLRSETLAAGPCPIVVSLSPIKFYRASAVSAEQSQTLIWEVPRC